MNKNSNNNVKINNVFQENKKISLFFICCCYLLFVLPVQLKPSHYPADDSYFYLQIAYNLASGFGSTFNLITQTNGYHPLWMIFCYLAVLLSGLSKVITIHLIIAIQQIMFIGIVYYFFKITRLMSLNNLFVSIPILALYFLTGLFASEAHLNGLMLLCGCFYFIQVFEMNKDKYIFITGFFFGLSILARLDNIFIVTIFFLQLLFRIPIDSKTFLRTLIYLILPVILLLTPYILSNLILFGKIVPISGKLHSSFPQIQWHPKSLGNLGYLVTIGAILSVIISFKNDIVKNNILKIILQSFGLGILIHSMWIILFSKNDIPKYTWYFVPGVINLSLLMSVLINLLTDKVLYKFSIKVRQLFSITIFIILILAGLSRDWVRFYNPDAVNNISAIYSVDKKSDERAFIELGKWMKKEFPENTKILIEDGAGMISWYSDLQILAIDGLTNDFKYNDDIMLSGINEYLISKGVDYYLGHFDIREGKIEIMSPLYNKSSGFIKLSPVKRVKDILFWRDELGEMENWYLCKIVK